jgi:hypothetical protein
MVSAIILSVGTGPKFGEKAAGLESFGFIHNRNIVNLRRRSDFKRRIR